MLLLGHKSSSGRVIRTCLGKLCHLGRRRHGELRSLHTVTLLFILMCLELVFMQGETSELEEMDVSDMPICRSSHTCSELFLSFIGYCTHFYIYLSMPFDVMD